ncbi:AmmeMemoRadiSam system protein A [Clostridium aciditolerans]|uniref:AmmeMemoRadiSam system protein A n=1 Tax=Clostridium aciditolerans TaxID=339861 RepID=A0A934LZU3_9CLOT|nr:AmmeMemoRadiSam system protein A [Clostridium aciditolerans]MBI6871364.1 AmmeMemoRadiSam system protein A [Clostridium aciditolerans]
MGKILGHFIMPHPPILVSEVGKGEELDASLTIDACFNVAKEISELKPETIIIITPHGPMFRDAIALTDSNHISGDFGNFNSPDVEFDITIDLNLTESIKNYAHGMGVPTIAINEDIAGRYNISHELDHGAMVPLYFVNKEYSNYKLVHITYGLLSETDLYKFGISIKQAVELSNTNVVVIASGDLSHKLNDKAPYGYSPEGKVFDEKILELLKSGDVMGVFDMDKDMIESAGECGLRSFDILLGTMEGRKISGEILSYEGPFGIGYGVMRFNADEMDDKNYLEKIIDKRKNTMKKIRDNEDKYVKLARETLEHHVKTGETIAMPGYVTEDMLSEQRGVFVSLKKDGELRGCIGTIFPAYENTAEEIIRNAIEAGERDPRFSPVEEEELDDIIYSVDVLMPPEEASRETLDPKKYGVIVRSGRKTGLLLPDLSGVDTATEQIDIALKKAGINPLENYKIERFEVIRHK